MDKQAQADNPVWQSMLANYRLDEVARHCLMLQQELDVDVVLLLFVVYLAEEQVSLDLHRLAALDQQLKPVRTQVILPLRQARQGCKATMGTEFPAYQALLAQELEFEWQQCLRLQAFYQQQGWQSEVTEGDYERVLTANLKLLSAYYPRKLEQTWSLLQNLLCVKS